ncbi:MAG: hypothetical protein LKE53_07795 [Oscillospiraceae bacterium]|nr:hypothetical protein [Oscillospiraceae bacterium]MDD3261303.1 hypothetical protein [Oscillospiraceae bacterium]
MLNWTDGKMSEFFFFIAFGCTILAMIFSPLELESWSVASASVAIVTALGGIYLAFRAWKEPLPEDAPADAQQSAEAAPSAEKRKP